MKNALAQARSENIRYAVPPRPMTLEEYARQDEPDDGYRYELIRGRMVVQEPVTGYGHGWTQSILIRRLGDWMEAFGEGVILGPVGCILSDRPATVRGPDIAVLLERRSEEGEPGNWIRGAPDVAIEILSPSNRPGEMREKIRDYFEADALRVWIVDPKTRTVTIHQTDGSKKIFQEGDLLEDPDVLPGFAVGVEELF